MPRPSRDRATSALRRSLFAATFLTPAALLPGLARPAMAAQLPVVATPVANPLLDGLAIPADAPAKGMWSGTRKWPIIAVSAVMLPTGKVLTFGAPVGQGVQDGRTYVIWDPAQGFTNGSQTILPGVTGVNSFCGAQAFQADGSLLVSGGIYDSGTDRGSAVLNPAGTGVSGIGAKLANDRYYSTMITQADGKSVIMGGSFPYQGGYADPQGSIDRNLMTGMTPEVFDAGNWRSLFGANSRNAFGPDNNRFWYPRAWAAPNGKIFGISSDNMWYLDTAGAGVTTTLPFRPAQTAATVATAAPNVGPSSTAAMYDVGKILQLGGNSFDNGSQMLASSLATTIDINGATPVTAETSPTTYGRSWANATVLPTGKVLVTGGSLFGDTAGTNTVLASEIWDPATGRWSVGAANGTYRGYHSTATLLQDGSVLVAGGGIPGPVDNLDAEIYYPPYLFASVNGKAALAPRPQIVSLSSNTLAHAQSMRFEVADSAGLSQVVFVGLSQGTHSFNSGQRRIPVAFTQADTLVTVQTPASGNIAPPGYYQIVAVDAKGVPSPGVIVALGANVAAPSGTVTVPIDPAILAASGGWAACASEGGTCTVANGAKTVRYGANGQYVIRTVTGSIACTNDAFGRDPLFGIGKQCQVATTPPTAGTGTGTATGGTGTAGTGTGSTTAGTGTGGTGTGATGGTGTTGGTASTGTNVTPCAIEGGTCAVTNGPKTVRYGANGQYVTKSVAGSIACTNDAFGRDPLFGVGKACQVVSSDIATGSVSVGASPFTQPTTGSWQAIGGEAGKVATAADGTTVVVNRNDGTVWLYQSDGTWQNLPGRMKDVAVVKANSIFGIGMDEVVYRFDGTTWTGIPSANNVSITAASDGTVVVVNRTNEIWTKPTDDAQPNWRRLPAAARKVVPMNGRSFWAMGLDNNVWRSDGVNGWAFVGDTISDIAASADGSVLVVNKNTGVIWRKIGDNAAANWNPVPNATATLVAAPNSQRILAVRPDGKLYRY